MERGKKRAGVNALKNNHIDLNGLDRQDWIHILLCLCCRLFLSFFFFFYTENFISLGALALKYHNVVTVKSSITAEGPNMCEYSCHIWWQIWLFTPFHMTGCGSAGVNASSVDKKALRQPFCRTMSYGCLFFPHYMKTSHYRTNFHISSQCKKLILVGSLPLAAGYHPTMILSYWHSYHI